jgi:hypothetical protein
LELRPTLTPNAVRSVLLSTAKDLGVAGRDNQFGAGLADAYRASAAISTRTSARTTAAR